MRRIGTGFGGCGLDPLEDRRGGVDENPATTAVPGGQDTEDIGGQDHADDVDRDELFDAIEDVVGVSVTKVS